MPATDSSGSWRAWSGVTGASTSRSSDPKPSSDGTAAAGGSAGGGRPALGSGRPRLSPEVRELIATMANANPRWGSERIRGELLKLGIVVSERSIQHDRRWGPTRPPSRSWRTLLRNHRTSIRGTDLLTVRTLTFRTLYVLVFVGHARRELVHLNVAASPTAAWVWRQLIQATPWGRAPRYPEHGRWRVAWPARARSPRRITRRSRRRAVLRSPPPPTRMSCQQGVPKAPPPRHPPAPGPPPMRPRGSGTGHRRTCPRRRRPAGRSARISVCSRPRAPTSCRLH